MIVCLLNIYIGLCFITVNEATLDKMVIVYIQTDPFASMKMYLFIYFTQDKITVTVVFLLRDNKE